MSSRIGYTPVNHKLWCNEVLDDIAFERKSENDDVDMDTSSTDSGSENTSPSKPKNISQISPQKLPVGLNLNKDVTPIDRNPDIARLARVSSFLQSTKNAYKENARDAFNKGVAALDKNQDGNATLYALRSNQYIEQCQLAEQGIQEVRARIWQGLEVIPTKKS